MVRNKRSKDTSGIAGIWRYGMSDLKGMMCSDTVIPDHSFRSYPCRKPAKFEVNGRFYCGIHNPKKLPTKAQIAASRKNKIQRAGWKFNKECRDYTEAKAEAGCSEAKAILDAYKEVVNHE